MKKEFERPELIIIIFDSESDIITASDPATDEGNDIDSLTW